MIHKHWMIMAFDEFDNNFNYKQPIEVNIEDALTEKDALRRASKIVVRKLYVVRKVTECSSCNIQKKTEKLIDKQLGEDHE